MARQSHITEVKVSYTMLDRVVVQEAARLSGIPIANYINIVSVERAKKDLPTLRLKRKPLTIQKLPRETVLDKRANLANMIVDGKLMPIDGTNHPVIQKLLKEGKITLEEVRLRGGEVKGIEKE